MFVVNVHNFKISEQVRSSADNQRAAIIEGLCAGCSHTEIIRVFEYPKSTVYVAIKYLASETSKKGFA